MNTQWQSTIQKKGNNEGDEMDLKNNPNKELMFLQKQLHQKRIRDDYFIKMSKESEKSAKKLPQTSQNRSFLKVMTVGNT